MVEVVTYTKSYCPYCKRVKELLTSKGIDFLDIDVEHDEKKYQEMVEKSGGRTSVPQVFVRGQHIGGCDETLALDEKGELDKLLAA